MLDALGKVIGDVERNTRLYEPPQLRERIEALDRFDVFNLEVPPPLMDSTAGATYRRAQAIKARLEAANFGVYEAIRRDIRSGRGAGALRDWLPARGCGQDESGLEKGEGYDYLDELVAGVLRFAEPETASAQRNAEMAPYQPTPARHIFDLFARTALTEGDVLIDLGSGLGHVPLLTCICTEARGIGVEFEPVYVHSAQRSAEMLDLRRATFIQQDAQTADLREGTVFYLYTPFRGKMLRSVLESMRHEAVYRDVRVCTFGSCALTVADEEWLEAVGSPQVDRISIFRSRNGRAVRAV